MSRQALISNVVVVVAATVISVAAVSTAIVGKKPAANARHVLNEPRVVWSPDGTIQIGGRFTVVSYGEFNGGEADGHRIFTITDGRTDREFLVVTGAGIMAMKNAGE